MGNDTPKSIKIKGDIWDDDIETLTETDNLQTIDGDDDTTEIFTDTEEARARVLKLLKEKEYTILEQ